ncbi:MAG: hypothetical protein K2P81_13505 [Bacteriovoracaceae bacterium]|nr:hypothetical protein [Bacteriovoracaceae bacterium]
MKNWTSFEEAKFEKWQQLVGKELKTDQIERLLKVTTPEGFVRNGFSDSAESWTDNHFSQAALSFTWTRSDEVDWSALAQMTSSGVWDFILDPFLLDWNEQKLVQEIRKAESVLDNCEARLWVASDHHFNHPKINRILSGHEAVRLGGSGVLEVASILLQIIDWAQNKPQKIAVALNMENEFFQSMAKMRASKQLAQNILENLNLAHLYQDISWMGRVSWRDFSGFDQANNILRNSTSLCASYLSGAQIVESLPYDLLIKTNAGTHARAKRLAITSQLILQSESGLGEVVDPSSGSFSIEEMTLNFAKVSWEMMQKMSKLNKQEQAEYLQSEANRNWLELQRKFATRKKVQTGVNDFSNPSEEIVLLQRWLKDDHVRLGRAFEELRLGLKNNKPSVCVAVLGDYAALQPRLNFTKNYFELLGLNVVESGPSQNLDDLMKWLKNQKNEIKVWVTNDEDHAKLKAVGDRCYVAGKTQVSGCLNLFSGQDIYATLDEVIKWWESRK